MVQPDRRSGRRPVSRLDAEGRRQVAPSWESLVERQLREAMEEGAFDELPYQGERLPMDDDSAAGDWAMAYRMLRNAGAAPPWIEADKDVRRLLERRDAIVSRALRGAPAGTPRPGGARGDRRRGQRRHRPPQRRGADGPPAPPPARARRGAGSSRRPRRPVTAPMPEPGPPDPRAPRHGVGRAGDPAHRPRRVVGGLPRPAARRDDRVVPRARLLRGAGRPADRAPRDVGRARRRGRRAVRGDRRSSRTASRWWRSTPIRRFAGWGSGPPRSRRSRRPTRTCPSSPTSWSATQAGESFYAARGFVPREPIDEQLGAELVRERRWWLERHA